LTAGIPVNLRAPDDESTGTAIGIMVAELGTNVPEPLERLEAIKRSTREAKRHLADLPPEARTSYTLLINGPWIAGALAGFGGRAPVPFNVGISNVPGPTEPLYFNGSRLDALFPLSLLLHGNALNITCVSYAGTLNFGFTGARDSLPHTQRLAIYMGEALEEIDGVLLDS
jgi:diacylglycerol O-acyltransferase / wax synthase